MRYWMVLIALLTTLALADNPALPQDSDGYPDAVEISSNAERTHRLYGVVCSRR